MHYVQELIYENFNLKIKFCELIEIRENGFANIVFSDEIGFEFYGNVSDT